MTPAFPTGWLRRRLAALLALGLASLLVACASLMGPHTYEIPLARLQQGLDRHFATPHRVLPLFDVQLARPQLALLPEQGRVALTLSPTIAPSLMSQTWSGTLVVSGQLAIDAARSRVVLREARVDRFVFDGVDAEHLRLIAKVSNVIAEQTLKELPLFTFKPEELRFAGVQYVPTRIETSSTGLRVNLEPAQ